jgi:hypothetical protein
MLNNQWAKGRDGSPNRPQRRKSGALGEHALPNEAPYPNGRDCRIQFIVLTAI